MSGIMTAMEVSASGMTAQRRRMELLITNIANSETTRTPQGGPFQRRDVVFSSQPVRSFYDVFSEMVDDGENFSEGVRVSEIVVTQKDPILRFQPNHPDADALGYVAFPDINPIEEMANLMSAARSFEANIKAFEAVKQIIQRSIDLGRRG